MRFQDVWDLDPSNELRNRTWWWYWWLLFLRNEKNPERPRQLMVLWATRNCRRVKVNEHTWVRRNDWSRGENSIEFDGLSASWYYDGERMMEPLFLFDGRIRSKWSDSSGELRLDSGRYSSVFSGAPESYRIRVDTGGTGIDISTSQWTDSLSQLRTNTKLYLRHLGYKMYKIRGVKASGIITSDGETKDVEGTAYFQKVRINSPTSPWYWGVFHTENGSYIDYFLPHMGLPVFRRKYQHRSFLDRWEKTLSRSFQFYDSETDEMHSIKDIRIKKRYDTDLPVFTLYGGDKESGTIEMEMRTYSRATWRIEQPFLGLFTTRLYYNEYPALLTGFTFRRYGRKITIDDIGHTVGNCEHSWGIV